MQTSPAQVAESLSAFAKEKARILALAKKLNARVAKMKAQIDELFGLTKGQRYDVIIEEEVFSGSFVGIGKEDSMIFFTFDCEGIGQVKLLQGQVPALTGVDMEEIIRTWDEAGIDIATL